MLLLRIPTRPDRTDVTMRTLVWDAVMRGMAQGDLDLDDIARRLGKSPRTLQRRLAEEGTSHSNIVDEARREMALRYLDGRLPLAEIAYLLGYSEARAFHRAFRRWTGLAPRAYARKNDIAVTAEPGLDGDGAAAEDIPSDRPRDEEPTPAEGMAV